MSISWFQLILGGVLLGIGLFAVLTSCIGVFKFKFCLNRLHAAAIGDTCGVLFTVLGMAVLTGFSFVSLKMLLLLVLFWIGCPVTSHLLVKLELNTDENVKKECEVAEE